VFRAEGLWTWETSGAIIMHTVPGVASPSGVRPAGTVLMLYAPPHEQEPGLWWGGRLEARLDRRHRSGPGVVRVGRARASTAVAGQV